MKRGTILFHRQFKFTDGELGKKYIVIINSPTNSEPYLILKTTSQPKNKPSTPGCHVNKSVFMLPERKDFFPLNTWIQFFEIFEFNFQYFLNGKFKGDLEIVGQLKEQTINEIVNCIKRSDDITKYQRSLLSGR